MGGREKRREATALEKVRRRFDAWRRTRKPHSRIPGPLWAAAVKLVGRYGLHRTARSLRVDYYSLKRRVEESTSGPGRATFVEVTAATSGAGECLVELEGADGAKMRIHLKGGDAPDLIALSRSFWDAPS